MPVWQGLVGWHAAPCAHAMQAPLSHTSETPHELPFGSMVPVSVHVEVPPVQARVPTWQPLVGVHAPPAMHARHVPLSQALPAPHGVPLLAALPVSLHVVWPAAQTSVPWWHTSTGVHVPPASQVPGARPSAPSASSTDAGASACTVVSAPASWESDGTSSSPAICAHAAVVSDSAAMTQHQSLPSRIAEPAHTHEAITARRAGRRSPTRTPRHTAKPRRPSPDASSSPAAA